MNFKCEVLEGNAPAPFEAWLHAAIMKSKPRVNAITRIHARMANIFSVTDRKLEPVHNHGSFFAGGVPVLLEKWSGGNWSTVASGTTNADGRVPDLLVKDQKLDPGNYRLTFETAAYFKSLKTKAFYPHVTVVFEINDSSHYHVPLLLSPYGYSTYRGS